MGAFHELSGMDRYGESGMAGDLAEGKVERYLESIGRPCAPFGPRRVSTARAQHMTWPPEIRHAPDLLGWGRFIEVQGSNGEDVIFKAKKLEVLSWWSAFMPVFLAIYLARQDEILICDLATVMWAVALGDELILDADTRNPKLAWKVPVEVLLERRCVDAFSAAKATGGGQL
jgi:hypothetical protein